MTEWSCFQNALGERSVREGELEIVNEPTNSDVTVSLFLSHFVWSECVESENETQQFFFITLNMTENS